MPESMLTWGQLALYVAAAIAVIVWAISQLLKTMAATYGAIIAALQMQLTTLQGQNNVQANQITSQAAQIIALTKSVSDTEQRWQTRFSQAEKDCQDQINKIRSVQIAEIQAQASVAGAVALRTDAIQAELKEQVEKMQNAMDSSIERRRPA